MTINDGILAGRRLSGTCTFEFRYLRLRAERARKKSDLKIEKKINNQKQYLLLKIILKNFALAILGGGGGAPGAPGAPPLNPPVPVFFLRFYPFSVKR